MTNITHFRLPYLRSGGGGRLLRVNCRLGAHLLGRVIPRQEFLNPALFVAVDDGSKRGGQVDLRINSIEFASFNERGDGCPVLGPSVVPCESAFFRLRLSAGWFARRCCCRSRCGRRSGRASNHPSIGDVGQSLAEWRLGRDTGTVMDEPGVHVDASIAAVRMSCPPRAALSSFSACSKARRDPVDGRPA